MVSVSLPRSPATSDASDIVAECPEAHNHPSLLVGFGGGELSPCDQPARPGATCQDPGSVQFHPLNQNALRATCQLLCRSNSAPAGEVDGALWAVPILCHFDILLVAEVVV